MNNKDNYLRKELYGLIKTDESIFDFIQDSSLDGLWYWDLENPENEWMNAKFWSVLGYNPDEMPHKSSTWQNIINHDDLKVANDNFAKHCENANYPYDQLVRYTHKNGSTKWIRCRGLAIRDNAGKPIRMLGAHQDVSDIKNREHELLEAIEIAKESEEKYRAMYNNAPLSYQSLDENGCFIDINPMWLKTLGYERSEVIGKWYGDFLHPDYVEHFRINFPAFKKRGYISNVQFQLRRKDNSFIYVSFEGCIGYTPEGKFKQTYCVFKDITEQKALENALIKAKDRAEESENRYRDLISNINAGIVVHATDTSILKSNTRANELLGLSENQIKGKVAIDPHWKIVDENNSPIPLDDFPVMRIVNSKKAMNNQIVGVYRNTDDIVWLMVNGFPVLNANNELSEIIISFIDITNVKHVEEALRKSEAIKNAMVSNISDVIVIIDKDGLNKYKSPNITKLFGWQPEELVGKNTWDNVHPDDLEVGLNFFGTILTEPNVTGTTELRYKRKDGNYVWIEISVINLLHDKDIQGILGNYKDITERKQAEIELEKHRNHLEELINLRTEELNTSNMELQIQLEKQKEFEMILQQSLEKELELNEMKSRFLSTTSHEFRTPLTSVLSSTQLLQRFGSKWSDDKKDEHFNRIITSIDYLTHLLDDILTLNRADSGKISFNPETMNLQKFAEVCLIDTKQLMTDMHELKFNYISNQKEFQLDPKLMKFVFNNLLSNAAKYSPHGGIVELKISTDKKNLLIVVSDEGIGIPSEDLHKIFDSFYRTKHGEDIAGTGLGLAIVKRAVELHSGDITVESELGKGTTFTVKIPIVEAMK